jgi:hypothetical protein
MAGLARALRAFTYLFLLLRRSPRFLGGAKRYTEALEFRGCSIRIPSDS